jgi:hypothetical protein
VHFAQGQVGDHLVLERDLRHLQNWSRFVTAGRPHLGRRTRRPCGAALLIEPGYTLKASYKGIQPAAGSPTTPRGCRRDHACAGRVVRRESRENGGRAGRPAGPGHTPVPVPHSSLRSKWSQLGRSKAYAPHGLCRVGTTPSRSGGYRRHNFLKFKGRRGGTGPMHNRLALECSKPKLCWES